MTESIRWRRLDAPGHDIARIEVTDDGGWTVSGTAVFAHDGEPCQLDYVVTCDAAWRTRGAHVGGWIGQRNLQITVAVSVDGNWTVNGEPCPAVAGCIDIDLGFTPATNLVPIRRLTLDVGDAAALTAAWLKFPSMTFAALPQVYARVTEQRYRYESGGEAFVSQLDVNAAGFVTRYPGLWEKE